MKSPVVVLHERNLLGAYTLTPNPPCVHHYLPNGGSLPNLQPENTGLAKLHMAD